VTTQGIRGWLLTKRKMKETGRKDLSVDADRYPFGFGKGR